MEMGTEGNVNPSSQVIKVPETLDGITPEWLSTVMGFTITSKDFLVTPNTQAGFGYLSSITRISCDKETEKGSERLDLIVKVLPSGESEFELGMRQLAINEEYDITEINFYEQVLPDLIAELPELQSYFCKFYIGIKIENPRNSILVLEDLKPKGYVTRNFAQILTPREIEETVNFLAKFHYAANAVEYRRKKPLSEIYQFLRGKADKTTTVINAVIDGYSTLDEFFESQNCDLDLRNYYARLSEGLSKIFEAIFAVVFQPLTLTHGDLWSNNIMVTDEGRQSPIKAIDWQLLALAHPAYDLAIVICTLLPPEELNLQNVEILLHLYLDTYTQFCEQNGLKKLVSTDRQPFSNFFYTYGMAYVFIWFTFSRDTFTNNFPRLVKLYEFLYRGADVVTFMRTLA